MPRGRKNCGPEGPGPAAGLLDGLAAPAAGSTEAPAGGGAGAAAEATAGDGAGAGSEGKGGSQPEPGFEQALERLEELVARLEAGELDLEQSLQLFQEGVRLHQLCARLLDRAEGRIKVLVEDGLGPRLEPWPGRAPAGGGKGREEEEE